MLYIMLTCYIIQIKQLDSRIPAGSVYIICNDNVAAQTTLKSIELFDTIFLKFGFYVIDYYT